MLPSADPEVRLRDRARDVDRAFPCSVVAHVNAIAPGRSPRSGRSRYARSPTSSLFLPRCGARCEPSANTTRDILVTAACRVQLIQNGGKNLVARHGTRNVAGDDGDFFARTRPIPAVAGVPIGCVQRVPHGVFAAHVSCGISFASQHADQVFIGTVSTVCTPVPYPNSSFMLAPPAERLAPRGAAPLQPAALRRSGSGSARRRRCRRSRACPSRRYCAAAVTLSPPPTTV